MAQDEVYSNNSTGSVSSLGLNKKPKKKKSNTPGLLQNQMNTAQQGQAGVLATMAENQQSLGTLNNGAMTGSDIIQKSTKRKTRRMQ